MSRETKYINDALDLYKPPFTYYCGYIQDADGHTFADTGSIEGEQQFIARIRGWGRISYYKGAEELQDIIGQHMAQALTDYWIKRTTTEGKSNG